MVFCITYRTHNAERSHALAVSVVEVALCGHMIGIQVVFSPILVVGVASLQPVMLIGLFPGWRVLALFRSFASVKRSSATRGRRLGEVLGSGQAWRACIIFQQATPGGEMLSSSAVRSDVLFDGDAERLA